MAEWANLLMTTFDHLQVVIIEGEEEEQHCWSLNIASGGHNTSLTPALHHPLLDHMIVHWRVKAHLRM
jgi:hypothetical protein